MDDVYSGLRRTRKRAHSSKCPCCYSSEEEQENHATAKKEKIKDGNRSNGKRTSTRKQKLQSDDDDDKYVKDDTNSPAETVDENWNSKKPLKVLHSEKPKKNGVKRGAATSKLEFGKDSQGNDLDSVQGKKQSTKSGPVASKKKNRGKNEDGLKNASLTELHSKSKKAKKNAKPKHKSGAIDTDKNKAELQDNYPKSKNTSAKAKALTSKSNSTQKQNNKVSGKKGLIIEKGNVSDDTKKTSAKLNTVQCDKQNKGKGKSSKQRNVSGGSSCELGKDKGAIPVKNKKQSSACSSANAKRKMEVFDHLFSELKKCPGYRKITVSSGTEILLKLTAEKLKSILPSSRKSRPSLTQDKLHDEKGGIPSSKADAPCTLSESKRRQTEPEKSLSVESGINRTSCPELTVSGKGEEAKLSQAAEALVSFRACIPLAQAADRDIGDSMNPEKISDTSKCSATKEPSSVAELVKMQRLASTKEVMVSQALHSFFVNASTQNKVTITSPSQSTPLPQVALQPSASLATNIEANLKQGTVFQQNMMSLDKLTPQVNAAPTIPSVVSLRASTPGTENLSTSLNMSSIMMNPMGVQNIQALFCQPTQPSNIQTLPAAQVPVQSLAASNSNPQLRPQQPLKGMEDVVSCVGSRTATSLLWNIKPAMSPVVYLTSPQMLSGVRARNLIPPSEGQVPLPFSAGVANVQSVGIPKTSISPASSSALTLGRATMVNQTPTVSATNVSGQRPILPREQRMPSLLPSLPQSVSQLSTPSVHVGSMPIQYSGSAGISSHSTGQTPDNSVVAQAPMTSIAIAGVTQAPVTQTPFMQVAGTSTGQLPAGSSTMLTPVSAKQAVKKFVHERTKSAELRRTCSMSNLMSQESVISSGDVEIPESSVIPASFTQGGQSLAQTAKEIMSNPSVEFNLHQAASALLSISTQDALEAALPVQPAVVGEGEDSQDEHDDEVVFTSKGVFRVGDVDVDPKYNRIGREGYACGKCGKIFTSLSYLARHIKRVCPDMSCRKWKCTMCDKAFRHPFGLQQHIYTHTGERPHKCSQCPKAFYSSNDLRRHSRIHSGERPYHCKHCDKSFATTISLKTHTYIHTGEKPHKCPHCPKTFATSSKLGRHIVTHSEQRPFVCDHCPKSFNRSGDLRRHNMHVHECRDRPFEFEDGNTPPSTATNLSGENGKDRCLVCGENFESSSDLRNHVLSHGTSRSPVAMAKQVMPSQEMHSLDENTELGNGDSN